jgi:hypothetical protein
MALCGEMVILTAPLVGCEEVTVNVCVVSTFKLPALSANVPERKLTSTWPVANEPVNGYS